MSFGLILLILAGVVLLGGYIWYASLIVRRNRVREALGSIDTYLRQRHDLVPNVLRIAQRFLEHERNLMTELTEARTAAQRDYNPKDPQQVAQHLDAEKRLQIGLGRLFAVAENYPELRSAELMREAQETYTEAEAHIAAARRFYNTAVGDLNNAVEIFPGSLIAGIAGVRQMPFFELDEPAARQPVNADEYLR